jgi:ABC-2 type transport system permease protein
MHNVWTLIQREYLERVRTRSFLIFTLLMPAAMAGIVFIPTKIAQMSSGGERRLVIVTNDMKLGEAVGQQLGAQQAPAASDAEFDQDYSAQTTYAIQVVTDTSDQERDRLNKQVSDGQLTGFLWLTDDALANRRIVYSTKEAADFSQSSELRSAVRAAVTKHNLQQRGMSGDDIDALLKPIRLETIRVEKGHRGASGATIFLTAFGMVMLLYAVVLVYGMSVMRSVIEEKSLTQILVWVIFAALFSVPGLVAAKSFLGEVHIPMVGMFAFAIFFLLGYLLYSSMYAAIGSMVNTDQEAQQMQWPAMMPILIAIFLMNAVIQHPNAPLSFWLSIIPFFAPILMLVRILIEQPPMWQIVLCIGLMLATIYGLLSLSARIYRVGILMYGKRPTLPELRRWLKYAG